MDQGHDINVSLGETLAQEFGSDWVTPLDLKLLGLVATALGDIVPLVGEGSGHAVKDLAFDKVAKGSLHDSPGRGGGDIDGALRVKKLLEPRLNRSVELFEVIATVTDHRLAKGLESFLGDLNGSRAEEFDM
jgi:hypothetical protein